MPTLYALIVGIDDYQGGPQKLSYACSDAQSIYNHLKSNLAGGYSLDAKMLTNGQATKQSIINGFGHFGNASGSDVCLFYFAGHGSEILNPPAELEHLARNGGKFESVVCHDSRNTVGADLSDQEIAHLIGTSTKNAFSGNGHFVVIMDCCHSGHGTRLEQDGEARLSRSIGDRHSQKILDFHGYSASRGYPQKGTHIQLAACGHRQEAWDGKYTPLLVRYLENHGAGASYARIQSAVCDSVSGSTGGKQIPEMYSSSGSLENLPFLGGAVR